MTIFDLVTAENIAVYYDENTENREPYFGESLWGTRKQLGLNIKNIKAARGLPVVIKASAYDVKAIPRLRRGYSMTSLEMPYFKESMYVDEVTRQDLNQVLQTGNQAMIDLIMNKIYNDPVELISAARSRREMMRMMILTTGMISVESNGQNYDYDYGVPDENKVQATTSWDNPDADIITDINTALDTVDTATGVRPTRGVMNRNTWAKVMKNKGIHNIIYPLGGPTNLTNTQISNVLMEFCDVEIVINNKQFIDDNGKAVRYIPDDLVSFFPSGLLGDDCFGTTPQESDLLTGSAANVAIVDTGVSVTTAKQHDPVNVETIVAMIYLPDFPMAEQLVIMDTNP